MLSELNGKQKLVGFKQCKKALKENTVSKLFVAAEAEERITAPLLEICEEQGIPFELVDTLKELGAACRIDVGAAVVALLK